MEITGRVIQILPMQSGQGKNGPWKKQDFIIETKSQYPKKVCMSAWGDKVDQFAIKEGEELVVSVEVESREYNSRWYTDVRAWKVVREQQHAAQSPSAQTQPPAGDMDLESFSEEEGEGDLPF